jgi:type III restriction enzyme
VLRDLGTNATDKQQVIILNDEAHHCYQDRPVASDDKLSADEEKANQDARVWFKGLQAVAKHIGIKQIYDLSATPFYLRGSGYNEGHIFPWTVSDFSLMDAIESGIVKVPRTPVDDDADHSLVTYLRLWDFIGDKLPKRAAKGNVENWIPEPELEGALRSLHRSYKKAFAYWETTLQSYGETPPVFIVVCPNTVVSKLVFDWIAGDSIEVDGELVAHKPGNLDLLTNVVDGKPLRRPRTILIDSAQLESGEGIKADFKLAAAAEIVAFKNEYRLRNPGADVDKITEDQLLREVMNTVGKKGKLGEHVRCVVSVSMLTEGWDANTVTHILGVRAFRSQLLCEQVVGRGLRRRSYAANPETGCFDAEYANVYGIPFQFINSDKPTADPLPPKPVIEVTAVEGREHLRICFPKLDGYRIEIPDEEIWLDFENAPRFEIGPNTVPRWVEMEGIVGEAEYERGEGTNYRAQEVAYALAKRILNQQFNTDEDRRPWMFPELARISRQWLAHCVDVATGFDIGYLMTITEAQAEASEAIWNAVVRVIGNRRERLRPMLNRFDPEGSTADVDFPTRKATVPTEKSEVSHVTLDGKDGNTWEQLLAAELELNPNVFSYVKNDHLGFTIPYLHKGRGHSYVPDFLVRLRKRDPDDPVRTLIIEVSGSLKSPGPAKAKAETARHSWCAAVNNHTGFGRWGYTEMKDPKQFKGELAQVIQLLYDDMPIIGDPDLLDFNEGTKARGA